MDILLTLAKLLGFIVFTIVLSFGGMWFVSRHERKPSKVKTYCTPEEIEQYVEKSRVKRRKEAKKRLKAYRKAKVWMHDEEAARWLEAHPDEVA